LMKLLRRNKEQDESLLRLEEILIKTNNRLEKTTKEHEELRCSHDDLVQRYDSILIEQRNNDYALSCVAQFKMENAMLKSLVDLLNLDKLALNEKYDMLSCSHYNLLDSHIMLNVAHEVVIDILNSYEPHSCSYVNLDNMLSYANPYYSKKGQSSIEQQVVGLK
jgi:hypothetical protein